MKYKIFTFLIFFILQAHEGWAKYIGIDICRCDQRGKTSEPQNEVGHPYLRIIEFDIENQQVLNLLFLKKEALLRPPHIFTHPKTDEEKFAHMQAVYGFWLETFEGDVVLTTFDPELTLIRTGGMIRLLGQDPNYQASLTFDPSVGLFYKNLYGKPRCQPQEILPNLQAQSDSFKKHRGGWEVGLPLNFSLFADANYAKGDVGEALTDLTLLSYGLKQLAIKHKESGQGIDGAYRLKINGHKKYIITETKVRNLPAFKNYSTPTTMMAWEFHNENALRKLKTAAQSSLSSRKNAYTILKASLKPNTVFKLAHLISVRGKGKFYLEEFCLPDTEKRTFPVLSLADAIEAIVSAIQRAPAKIQAGIQAIQAIGKVFSLDERQILLQELNLTPIG